MVREEENQVGSMSQARKHSSKTQTLECILQVLHKQKAPKSNIATDLLQSCRAIGLFKGQRPGSLPWTQGGSLSLLQAVPG